MHRYEQKRVAFFIFYKKWSSMLKNEFIVYKMCSSNRMDLKKMNFKTKF